jgi:hypothetical protein
VLDLEGNHNLSKGNISPLIFGILTIVWVQCLCTGDTNLSKGQQKKKVKTKAMEIFGSLSPVISMYLYF